MQTYGKIDSKFRFVILASKRAKQLIKGAKVKIRTKSKNPIRIAQTEVKDGLIDYEILQDRTADLLEVEEQVFTADDAAGEELDGGGGEGAETGEVEDEAESANGDEESFDDDFAGEDSGGEKDEV